MSFFSDDFVRDAAGMLPGLSDAERSVVGELLREEALHFADHELHLKKARAAVASLEAADRKVNEYAERLRTGCEC